MKKKNIISIVLLSVALCITGCKNNNKQESQTPSIESVDSTESIVSEESSEIESKSEEESTSEEESEERITEGSIKNRLKALARVKNVSPVGGTNYFTSIYSFNFEQYIDHEHKELGTFSQRVEIGFNGFDLPNVYVSEGYLMSIGNGTYYQNENEIAFLLGCNYIFVEHRYFGESLPVEAGIKSVPSSSP